MTLAELRERLAELDEEKAQISAELQRSEEAAATARRIEAVRDSLAGASGYNPVHAEWYEDPDAVHPRQYLSVAARQEEIRTTYVRYGARFEVDAESVLSLRLSLDLEEVG